MAGARRFVRVLQLLGEHPLTRVRKPLKNVARASGQCRSRHPTDPVSGRDRGDTRTASPPQLEIAHAAQVQIPLPDLSRFDQSWAPKTIDKSTDENTNAILDPSPSPVACSSPSGA